MKTFDKLEQHYAVRRGKPYNQRCQAMDSFNETDHPRDSDGKFGSGSSSNTEEPKSVKVKTRHPFVSDFLQRHTSIKSQEEYLKTVPKEKLNTALKITENHIDPASTHVRYLIEKELDNRANHGR